MKNIVILGSTGSIGTQTLDIVSKNNDLKVSALAAYGNIELLEKQIREFMPKLACVYSEEKALELKANIKDLDVKVVSGMDGLIEAASIEEAEIVVTAIVGMIGIRPTMAAIKAGKDIALANKETLVTAGHIIIPAAKEYNVSILPVDSEHSAIFQCLNGERKRDIDKILLTASGGPFRGKTKEELESVTVEAALKHPNWAMGRKITIDSATLVNKGLEAYKEAGIDAKGYVCDVTDEDAVNAMVAKIEEEVGVVDILVNNAGIIKRVPMHEMPAADFRQVIDVDLNAPFIVSKAVLPSMMKQRSGKIINICSMMSEFGRETVSAYASAKGGLKMLTRNIASEYGSYNIQCNGIGPGYIATPQTAPLREPQADGSKAPFDMFITETKTPAGRWGDPEDLAGPAVFLASSASDFVNGQILYVDGGIQAYFGKFPG